MAAIKTRKATKDDLETLLQFEQGVIATERSWDPTLQQGEIHYYDIEKMMDDPNIQLVVAEENGEVIGSGYARIENAKPYLRHPQHAYLGFMYVLPSHRGKGVNQLVIEALKAWSRSRNMTELRLDVYFHNDSAIRAYEKIGFAKHMIAMRMGL